MRLALVTLRRCRAAGIGEGSRTPAVSGGAPGTGSAGRAAEPAGRPAAIAASRATDGSTRDAAGGQFHRHRGSGGRRSSANSAALPRRSGSSDIARPITAPSSARHLGTAPAGR